jgi:hypothetical protein
MCTATTKLGRRCRKQAVDRGLCVFHSGRLDMAELGKRGGQARARKKEEQPGDELEGLAHDALAEMLRSSSGSATARAAAARIALSSTSPVSAEMAKRVVTAEMKAQMELALPSARAELERLIDARAGERVDALTEERLAERVEQLAEEKYRKRMKAETEAVAAELRVDE